MDVYLKINKLVHKQNLLLFNSTTFIQLDGFNEHLDSWRAMNPSARSSSCGSGFAEHVLDQRVPKKSTNKIMNR